MNRKNLPLFRPYYTLLTGITCILLSFIPKIHAQDKRQVIPFNSEWKFHKGSLEAKKEMKYEVSAWETVQLPHTYNKADMQLDKNFYTGDAYYQKTFKADSTWKYKRVYIRFEGAGAVATIYLNGRYLTTHKGAYAAFAFEIGSSLNYEKENTILVKTNNTAQKTMIPINHFLFPVYGGLYRPVELLLTDKINIIPTDYASPGIYITQKNVSAQNAEIQVKTKIENRYKNNQNITVQTTVTDSSGQQIVLSKKEVVVSPQGLNIITQSFNISQPHLWNGVNDPYLYTLKTALIAGGKEIDAVTQSLGIRSFDLRAGEGLFLNGKKYPMYGVTRHQDRWQFGSALSPEQHKEDLQLIKEMGATTIRLAHYQQAEDLYALADKMGFLIWAEIPFVNNTSYEESENAKQQMTELVRQNMNHPSIYIWGLHNEVYAKTKDEHVPVLTRELNDIAKTDDPDRLTVSVSGYGEMDRPANLAGDVQGMNRYYGWYEGKIDGLDQWATSLEQNYPTYKVMLSEYGADGNIDQGTETLPKPKSFSPTNGSFFPESYQTETHVQQWAIIQKHPYITASYLWNMFDFAVPMWNRGGVNARNLKGLVTFDRKRKKDSFYWYKANWNPAPMLYLANRRDSIRTIPNTSVQVFTNLKTIKLKVNGKIIQGKSGVNDKHWVFNNVELKKGKNKIEAFGSSGKESLYDQMTWILH